ncbi:potassium channel family protein [Ideonella sp.]|jgi:voltage-gated potassium channel|uniref:potassium channel family protein n=1 Tax=Ideonella sp. TaxID=1929293 RepID=UPI0037BE9965
MSAASHHSQPKSTKRWGLAPPRPSETRALRVQSRWRVPVMLALLATVPAFYVDLLPARWSGVDVAVYGMAALVLAGALLHVSLRSAHPWLHVFANPTELVLIVGLVLAALLPPSHASTEALGLRLLVAFISLARMVWSVQHLISRGSVTYLLLVAVVVLAGCGLGYWWIDPSIHSFGEGIWLAFTTAATVGYGDVVPTTPAAKVFSVFVVLLGYGVLTLVTAAIATRWVETEERRIEHDILRDLHRELGKVNGELSQLRSEVAALRQASSLSTPPVGLDVDQPVKDQ